MKNSVFAHSTNILLVILLIWIISVGCKNSNSNNANTTTNEISGEVFPANEVCNYPDIPIIKKYGGFNLTWGKGDTETDFRYLCNPFPTKLLTLFHDEDSNSYKPTTTEIQISYSARGNRIEGAHTIYMEYRAVTDQFEKVKQLKILNQKYRKEVLSPLISEIIRKALKQPLSSTLTEKIQSGKIGTHRPESCEKLGSGFICVDNFGKEERANYAEVYIFANEEALKKAM